MDYEKELEKQYNAINKYQQKMNTENNYYYEPTIRTMRNDNGITLKATMPLITKEEMITIDNNLQNIVNEYIQKIVKDKDLALSQYIVKKQNDEKQQLINWLEDKIKENEGIIQMSMGSLNEEFFDRKVQEEIREKLRSVIKECENKIDAFQEVLDFVNKGGKDE